MRLTKAKLILSLVWILLGLGLFALFIVQDSLGRFGNESGVAQDWFLPKIVPTLTLIVTAWVVGARLGTQGERIHSGAFLLALIVSLFYIVLVGFPVWFFPLSNQTPLQLMQIMDNWMLPLQGLTGLALGVFFGSRESEELPGGNNADNPAAGG